MILEFKKKCDNKQSSKVNEEGFINSLKMKKKTDFEILKNCDKQIVKVHVYIFDRREIIRKFNFLYSKCINMI